MSTLFIRERAVITYKPQDHWLIVRLGDSEVSIPIGPDGLIDAGLRLCDLPNREDDFDSDIHIHPDGVFSIWAGLEGTPRAFKLSFFEEASRLSISLEPETVLALGLAFIREGHLLNQGAVMYFLESEKGSKQ